MRIAQEDGIRVALRWLCCYWVRRCEGLQGWVILQCAPLVSRSLSKLVRRFRRIQRRCIRYWKRSPDPDPGSSKASESRAVSQAIVLFKVRQVCQSVSSIYFFSIALQSPRGPILPLWWPDILILYFEVAKRDVDLLRVGERATAVILCFGVFVLRAVCDSHRHNKIIAVHCLSRFSQRTSEELAPTLNRLFGMHSGLGMSFFTFDWAQINMSQHS